MNKIKVESTFNPEDGSLPYFYRKPGTPLEWFCGYTEDGKQILSIFKAPYNGKAGFQENFVKNEQDAKFNRDELIKNGWEKGKININVRYDDDAKGIAETSKGSFNKATEGATKSKGKLILENK